MKKIFPSIKIDIERWKFNSQYNLYISTHGRFKDINKNIIKPLTGNKTHGYLVLQVSPDQYESCHRLVMKTWKPVKDDSNLSVDHLDHNTRNNRLDNLEWVTISENLKRAQADHIRDNDYLLDNEKILLDNLYQERKQQLLNNGQLKNINLNNPLIKCGNYLFKTYEEAIEFLIYKKKVTKNSNKKKIKNGIVNSIISKNKYCNLTFELK